MSQIKKFYGKTLGFSFTVVLTFFTFFLIKKYLFKTNNVLIQERLIMGDSHALNGIKSDIIKYQNISTPGEPIIMTYLKLKTLIEKKYKVSKIVLSLGPHSFSSFQDIKFEDQRWSIQLLSQLKYLDISEKTKRLLSVNKTDEIFNEIREGINLTKRDFFPFTVVKEKINNDFMNSNELNEHAQYRTSIHFPMGELTPFSIIQKAYLDSIIEISNKQNIEIRIVAVPVSQEYLMLTPNKFIDSIINYNFNNSSIENYLELYQDFFYFKDSDHLNESGAIKFSEFMLKKP